MKTGKPLTAREADVLRLTQQGLTACEIALQFGIKKKTIGNYRSAINKKMGDGYTQRDIDSITGTADDL